MTFSEKTPYPLDLPQALKDHIESPIVDALEVVLFYLDDLPSSVRETCLEHLDEGELISLRDICSGFVKMRNGELPSYDELNTIAHPGNLFASLADSYSSAASALTQDREIATFIQHQIVQTLNDASYSFLADPQRALIGRWFEHLTEDPSGPYHDSDPAP